VPRARGNAARLLEEAEGYRTEVEQRSQGDAERFNRVLVEYQKAPGVTRDRLYLDMMQTVLSNSSKVLVDQKSGSLLYLPVDKLVQQSGATPPSVAIPDVGAAPPRAATPDTALAIDPSRSRDALRNREGR